MRATIMRRGQFAVENLADPQPAAGEVLVRTLACGICGSDLHAFRHPEAILKPADIEHGIVMGHEYCAEIVDYGPGTARKLKPGTRVCAMPLLTGPDSIEIVGYSVGYPGGFGEYMRLPETLLLPVPNGLATDRAAMTEPMAVGLHAVQRANASHDDAPLVIGCGPVGLAVIIALKLKGIGPVVAADFSPRRRELAKAVGADIVIDPKDVSPFTSWHDAAAVKDPARAQRLSPWTPFPARRPALIFECVGVPGMIESVMAAAPPQARIVVVGLCMESDHFLPVNGIMKELSLQFVLGYNGEEFAASLENIAEGKINPEPLITGKVGIAGVAQAFQDLASPETHAKILVEPGRK
jgi:threonine dehydrogenase-like Zn-dependent dehydrogenase